MQSNPKLDATNINKKINLNLTQQNFVTVKNNSFNEFRNKNFEYLNQQSFFNLKCRNEIRL